MTGNVSKRKAKRACIDCHFLAEVQNDTEEAGLEPYEMEPKICHYYVEADRREPIKRNDYSWIQFPLVCYRGCWRGCNDKEKQHEEVVEIDRSDCPLFFEYKPGMSFGAAEKIQDKMAVLEAHEQSSKTESERKAKRACIDCHFLGIGSIERILDITMNRFDPQFRSVHAEAYPSHREQIKKKENITLEDYGPSASEEVDGNDFMLGCYKKCWDEAILDGYEKRYATVVETDRSDCIFFYRYRLSMPFKIADKMHEKAELLQSSQNKSKSNKTELKTGLQEVKSIETTLSYNKTTGKFRFGKIESVAVSKTSRTRVSNTAEKLMKWWGKGKSCPQSEIVKDPARKTPQGVHDDISKIRKALEPLGVNMLQCTSDGYPPPNEPKNFNIASKKLD